MLRVALVLVIASVAMLPVAAAPIVFTGNLSGPAEEPPNASPGTGVTFVTIDPVAHTLMVQVAFSGLIGLTTASHIHVINGPGDANTADTNGPVATTVPTFANFPLGVTAGTYNNTLDTLAPSTYSPAFLTAAGGTPAAAEAALFSGIQSGRAYLNIHSTVYGGGEIRDFLEPVPEPSTVGLAALGLVALLVTAGRRGTRN